MVAIDFRFDVRSRRHGVLRSLVEIAASFRIGDQARAVATAGLPAGADARLLSDIGVESWARSDPVLYHRVL